MKVFSFMKYTQVGICLFAADAWNTRKDPFAPGTDIVGNHDYKMVSVCEMCLSENTLMLLAGFPLQNSVCS